ncbi:MAG: DEAD/DEAH box helicase, partial [Flavobacteriales bacterium]
MALVQERLIETPIEYLKGVGPKRGDILRKEANIHTFEDLLYYFPFRYEDRTKFQKIEDLGYEKEFVQIKGVLKNIDIKGEASRKRLTALLKDDTGVVELVWFKGIKWVKPSLIEGKEYIVFGKCNYFNKKVNLPHPEITQLKNSEKEEFQRLEPVYPSGEKLASVGLNSKGFSKIIKSLLKKIKEEILECFPENILESYKLMNRQQAFINIHFPSEKNLLKHAQKRLKFEELFFVQLSVIRYKLEREKENKGFIFNKVGGSFNNFYKEQLDFNLTKAQKRVIKEIRGDMGSGKQMNRLLQGDVGSGKTIVAILSILIAIDNGYQAAVMGPTETLANQHFETFQKFLDGMELNLSLLTGSTKTSE